jgi:L-rhamnose isomerase
MPLKVNEFTIEAKVIEDENEQETSALDQEYTSISDSEKQEIIDECVIRMTALLDREKSRY